MDLANLPLFAGLTKRLAWLGQRQEVLARNVANADTPGYMPRDLVEPDFLKLALEEAKRGSIATASTSAVFESREDPDTYEINPTGNGVVIEQQLIKVAKTASDFQLMTNLYRKHLDMLRIALGRGSGA
jgi:flagellar basal-body rod protein FlgB